MTNWNGIIPPAPVFYSQEQKAAILADYYAGMKVKEISDKHGCHECSAARIARRAGLPIRDKNLWNKPPSWPDEKIEKLKRLWQEGLSASRIGELLGISKGSVIGKKSRLGLMYHGPHKKPGRRKLRHTERTTKPRTKAQTLSDNSLKMRSLRTKQTSTKLSAGSSVMPIIKGKPVLFLSRKMHRECSALINHGVPVGELMCCGGRIPEGSIFQFCRDHLKVFTHPPALRHADRRSTR